MSDGSEMASGGAAAVLGVDTDALVHWAMEQAPQRQTIRRCFAGDIERAAVS